MRCNLIMSLILLMLLSNHQVFSYFITVDETKFHLVKSYLCRYGYMNENVCKQHADDSLKFMQNNARDIYRGLVIFQTMFNITRTGKIDEETIMKMAKPRCGNKDFDLQFSSSKFLSFRTNDFSILRRGLRKLTYSIKKYNPYLNRFSKTLSNEAVENLVEKAFNIWLKHLHGDVRVRKLSDIDEIYENSNITIYFAEGNHGDSMLFDGIDGELAHSCSLSNNQSPFRGHIHLDDSENWGYGNRLMSVLIHEIGHLFGLDHSSNPKSIMSPLFYFGGEGILEEDIKNLRMILGLESKHKLYEQTETTTTTKTSTPFTTEFIPTESPTKTTTTSTTSTTTPTTTTTTTTTPTTTTTTTTTTTPTTTTTTKTTTKITTETTTTATIPTTASTTTTTSTPIIKTATSTFQTTYFESTRILPNETIQINTTLPIFSEQKFQSAETSSEYYSDEDYYTESDFQSTSTARSSESSESEELSEEVDTTAEIIINKNSQELKPYSQSLVATKNVEHPEQHSSDAYQTRDYNYFTSSALNSLNSDDEYYQDELMLVTTSPDTSSKSFLTSLLDSALLHLNKTNYFNIEPSIATLTQTKTTNLPNSENYEDENEEYEDSYESEDTVNDSEFLELLKLIGTTTPGPNAFFPETPSLNITTTEGFNEKNNTTEGFNGEDTSVNQTEKIFNSTDIPSFEYFTTQNIQSALDNFTFIPATSPEPLTTIELKTTQHLENLTSEHMTTEEPIETESTFADIVQTTQASFTTENYTDPVTTLASIATTENLIRTTLKLVDEPADLCNDPIIDAITRTEWGNALVFKGNYIWHIRGLTKWRLFDYEGWPKKISQLFPGLPGNIDSAYLNDDLYHFTKNQTIWKYKVILSYPPKYLLVPSYPKLLKEEYPDIPFKSVDSAFSIATSIFFFKDYEFWQSDWNSNVTGKIPFKTNAAVSWRNPRLDNSLTEPLAYIVSNSSLYKFNYWSIPISQESLDIRYFLFDCVQANYKPHNPLFLGPSYKQAFIADDIYSKESRIAARHAPSYLARLARNSNDQHLKQNEKESNVLVKNFYSSSNKLSIGLINLCTLLLIAVFNN